MNITVSDELAKKLDAHVKKEKKFSSVQEYVADLLRQVVEKLEKKSSTNNSTTSADYSKEEEEKVAKRLRDLGYIT